jgi:tRNA-specific 2-thiouridylase
MRIAVAMSGGADSTLAALLLRDEGHDVVGLTAWLWKCSLPRTARACCGSLAAVESARQAARSLGIEHESVDLSEAFEAEVIAPTAREYLAGRTPNPCVLCNARVRFPLLAQEARRLACCALATGHYARVRTEGRLVRLSRGSDPRRDQSYFLCMVAPEDLAFARFPLAEWTKEAVRARLAEAGLPAASVPSSQDLCFGDLQGRKGILAPRIGGGARPGRIVHVDGRVLGEHEGLVRYTVGQRKGIGVASREPLYVVALRPETDELVVGPAAALDRRAFEVSGLTWLIAPDRDEVEVRVQVRYRTAASEASVRLLGEGRASVRLERPVRAVAPGQTAVFYDAASGEVVLGGGWIDCG